METEGTFFHSICHALKHCSHCCSGIPSPLQKKGGALKRPTETSLENDSEST